MIGRVLYLELFDYCSMQVAVFVYFCLMFLSAVFSRGQYLKWKGIVLRPPHIVLEGHNLRHTHESYLVLVLQPAVDQNNHPAAHLQQFLSSNYLRMFAVRTGVIYLVGPSSGPT